MTRMTAVAAVCLLMTSWAGAQSAPATQATTWPRLVNARMIVTRDDDSKEDGSVPATQGPWTARLSPDGVHLLYVRTETIPVKAARPGDPTDVRGHRIILRDMLDNTDKRLPIPVCTSDEAIPMLMKMNVFDRMGKKIALGVGEDSNKCGYSSYGKGDKMQACVYDIEGDRLDPLGIRDLLVVPAFDRTAKNVYAWTWDRMAPVAKILITPVDPPQPRKLDVSGVPWNMSPAADLLPINATPLKGGGAQSIKYLLYDLGSNRAVADLPVKMDAGSRLTPQWTSDGRYLYYPDTQVSGEGKSMQIALTTCIYDSQDRKQVGAVERCYAIGPGPTPTTMVMFMVGEKAADRWIVLHDLTKGTKTRLAEPGLRPLDARGKYVLYAKSATGGKETIYRAEIAMSEADVIVTD